MKKMKKGFSMVELLFVMILFAALAAVAVPNLSKSEEGVILTGMKNDATNLVFEWGKLKIEGNSNSYKASQSGNVMEGKTWNSPVIHLIDNNGNGFNDNEITFEGSTYVPKIPMSNGNKFQILGSGKCGLKHGYRFKILNEDFQFEGTTVNSNDTDDYSKFLYWDTCEGEIWKIIENEES